MTSQTDVIEKQILLRAPRDRVWRAITDASEFGAWFRVALEGQFAAGKAISGKMTYPGYEGAPFEVVVDQIVPQSLFSFRWHPYDPEPGAACSQEPMTLVSFRLEDTPEGTLLTVTESGFDALPPERRAAAFRENREGWEIQTQNLEEYLESNA
jgi:uncharacterized protein YndB with AHSA1/START domain